jgi:hypothetical protein
MVGFFDCNMTMIGVGLGVDFTEGVTFNVTLYSATRTYMPSKNGVFAWCLAQSQTNGAIALRYD